LTDIYNVLEKLRAGEELTTKDQAIHDAALVSTLKQLHDDLDAAVADAYGWPWPMTDMEILEHVVALNAARAAEETAGVIRWLRLSSGGGRTQLEGGTALVDKPKTRPQRNRENSPGRQCSPNASPRSSPHSPRPREAAYGDRNLQAILRAKEADLQEILDSLYSLGRARPGDIKGTFVR